MPANKIIKIAAAALVLAVSVGALGLSAAMKNPESEEPLQKETGIVSLGPEKKPDIKPGDSMPINESAEVAGDTAEPVFGAEAELDSQALDIIKGSDKKNAERNMKSFKNFLKEFAPAEKRQGEIMNAVKKGHRVPDVLTAYDFLSENYGLMSEMEALLNEKKGGKQWAGIFKEYTARNKEFRPTNFKPGFLEELMKDPAITGDDVMNADRISQKKLKGFDELIAMRKQGMTWKEIKTGLGLANTEEALPRIAAESSQVEKYMRDTGLTEEQVIDGMIIAGRTGSEEQAVIKKLESGKKREEVLSEAYAGKYGK